MKGPIIPTINVSLSRKTIYGVFFDFLFVANDLSYLCRSPMYIKITISQQNKQLWE